MRAVSSEQRGCTGVKKSGGVCKTCLGVSYIIAMPQGIISARYKALPSGYHFGVKFVSYV